MIRSDEADCTASNSRFLGKSKSRLLKYQKGLVQVWTLWEETIEPERDRRKYWGDTYTVSELVLVGGGAVQKVQVLRHGKGNWKMH